MILPVPKVLKMPPQQPQRRNREAEQPPPEGSQAKVFALPTHDEPSELNEICRWVDLADRVLGNIEPSRKRA